MLMSLTAVCTQCLQSLSALTVASSIRKLLAACRSFRQYPPNYKITRMWANANVMATLPNIGATLCLMLQPLVAVRSPYSGDMWRRYYCLTSFFPIINTCLSCKDTARQRCAMVPRWQIFGDFLRPAFPASCLHHISDLHSKFALGPHHV